MVLIRFNGEGLAGKVSLTNSRVPGKAANRITLSDTAVNGPMKGLMQISKVIYQLDCRDKAMVMQRMR